MAMRMSVIWVAIRGLNYTDRATREVGRNIDELIKKQQELRAHSTQLIMAGTMWVAMAGMATFAIGKIVEASMEGRRAVFYLSQATNNLLSAMGTAFAKALGPTMTILTAFFNALSKAPPWIHSVIAAFVLLGITLIAIKGMSMLTSGAWDLIMQKMTTMGIVSVGTSHTMTASFVKLQAAMGPIILAFSLGAMVASMFGHNIVVLLPVIAALIGVLTLMAAILWSNATAVAIISFGIAALAGAAAIGVAQATMPSYQTGTEYVRRTGPAIVHEGDRITSASDRWMRPAQTERATSTGRPTKTSISNTFSIGTVQTKADKEELKPQILKWIREAMDDVV